MLTYLTVVYITGDLLIQLEVAEDPYFKRQDADVHVEVPITLTQVGATWGCWVGYMSIVQTK
jgi:DnaJ-class molecular chaperone